MLRKAFQFFVIIGLTTLTLSFTQAQTTLPLPGKSTVELLSNPGFETDTDANKIPDGWEAKNMTLSKSDKIKCEKPESPVAHSGNCALMFRGNPDGSTSTLSQKIIDLSSVTDGTTLTFSAYIDPHSATPGAIFGKATVVLSDSSKLKLKLVVPEASAYTLVSDSTILNLAGVLVSKIQVKLVNDQSKGKFFVDDASLTISEIVATATSTDQLTNTPVEATTTPTTQPSATSTPVDTDQPSITPDAPTSTQTLEVTSTFTATQATHTPTNTPTPTSTATAEPSATFTSTSTATPVDFPIRLVPSDGEDVDLFGETVAIEGNIAVINAPLKDNLEGAVYIFSWNGSIWTEQQKLNDDDPESYNFGRAIAISGDTLVIGGTDINDGHGVVYVFTNTNGIWSKQQKLITSNAANEEVWEDTLAIYEDTLLIQTGSSSHSQIYVFTHEGNSWVEQQILTSSDEINFYNPGGSLALEDDTLLVGKSGVNAVYVFTRNNGIWSEQQKLTASDAGVYSFYFGNEVALSGDTAMIADYRYYANQISEFGAVYVFTRNNGIWSEQQKLIASDIVMDVFEVSDYAEFGHSIALADHTVIIGAPWKNCEGQAYSFTKIGNLWQEQQIMIAGEDMFQCQDLFGYSVALHSETILISSPSDMHETDNIGSVWVFNLP